MKTKLEGGMLTIAGEVFTSVAGYAATNCFGVKGMAFRNVQDGFVHLLKKESLSKGVRVTPTEDGCGVSIELHIVVDHGVNIPVISQSIMSEVRYHVERQTGVQVGAVHVFVDSIWKGRDN